MDTSDKLIINAVIRTNRTQTQYFQKEKYAYID